MWLIQSTMVIYLYSLSLSLFLSEKEVNTISKSPIRLNTPVITYTKLQQITLEVLHYLLEMRQHFVNPANMNRKIFLDCGQLLMCV